MSFELAKEFDRLSLGFLINTQGVTVELEPTLEQDIRKGQREDEKINEIRQLIIDGKGPDFHEDAKGVIWFKDRMCVHNIKSIWELILALFGTAYFQLLHKFKSKFCQTNSFCSSLSV
jgi:hypothetical protein